MEIKIYADVLFFINFFMDFLLLYISAKLAKAKINLFFIVLSALLGSIFAVLIFFLPNFSGVGIVKIFFVFLMVYITFLPRSLRDFVKKTSIFIMVFVGVGGVCFCLLFFTGAASRLGTVLVDGILYINFPIYKLILSCAFVYGILSLATKTIKKHKSRAEIHKVEISWGKETININAFCDSGNLLKEPRENKGVLIMHWKKLKKLFKTKEDFTEFVEKNADIFVPVPYKTVAGHFVMMAFLPDGVRVDGEQTDIFVGVSEVDFNDYYDGILPKDFNEGDDTVDGTDN